MKPSTIAPAYVILYAGLSEIARKHGYALAVHGSVVTDFDLVAVPWKEDVSVAETLIRAFAAQLNICLETAGLAGESFAEPSLRPHGRKSWLIPLKWEWALDISVMPRLIQEPPNEVVATQSEVDNPSELG